MILDVPAEALEAEMKNLHGPFEGDAGSRRD